MAFRTVIINKASRINLDLNNIVVYYKDDPYWINLDDISSIIIEDPRCLVSLKLLTEITSKGISMILCDSKHLPIGTLETLRNNARTSRKISNQIEWEEKTKKYLWTCIVKQKIYSQIKVLKKYNKLGKIEIMNSYYNTIEFADTTNREGLASRTYFKELFGSEFKRFNEDIINFALNYTYQIIRSKISQVIVSLGYTPTLGINHKSELNQFNLADDFIEVYRPIVDYYIYEILNNSEEDFLTPDIKEKLVNILNTRINYNNTQQKIHNSISIYLQNMFVFLEHGIVDKIIFPIL